MANPSPLGNYSLIAPHPALGPFIDCYWLLYGLPVQERIIVDGQADLIFTFGSPYQRQGGGPAQNLSYTNLDGQRLAPVQIWQAAASHLVGVRFRAGGLAAFLPFPMAELTNQTLEGPLMFGLALHHLEEALYEAAPNQVGPLLDSFFLKRLKPPRAYDLAQQIALGLQQRGGQISIQSLSRDLAYSIRSLDRAFQAVYGFSPKSYARIVRFQKALTDLNRLPLATLAAVHGYYDQAHLAKDFAALSGLSPETYRQEILRPKGQNPQSVQFLQENAPLPN